MILSIGVLGSPFGESHVIHNRRRRWSIVAKRRIGVAQHIAQAIGGHLRCRVWRRSTLRDFLVLGRHSHLRQLCGSRGLELGSYWRLGISRGSSILKPASCHGTSLTSAFDPLVAVLVVFLKIFEKVVVVLRHFAMLRELHKHLGEFLERRLVKVVLVCLQIPYVRMAYLFILISRLPTFMFPSCENDLLQSSSRQMNGLRPL